MMTVAYLKHCMHAFFRKLALFVKLNSSNSFVVNQNVPSAAITVVDF